MKNIVFGAKCLLKIIQHFIIKSTHTLVEKLIQKNWFLIKKLGKDFVFHVIGSFINLQVCMLFRKETCKLLSNKGRY